MKNSLGTNAIVAAAARPGARVRAALTLAGLALALGLSTGCDRATRSLLSANTPPTITLTSGPVDTASVPNSWIVDISWTATDPDGVIDHFEYALDPPTLHQASSLNADTAWTSTRETRTTARFRAAQPNSVRPVVAGLDFHTFALRAVDDLGAVSPVVIRAFFAANVAPDVQITQPLPSALLRAQVPVPFRIEWEGDDPDGQGKGKGKGRPIDAYRIRLLHLDDPNNNVYLSNPDSLVRQGVATNWQDWRLVDGDTTFYDVTESEIGIGQSGLFAVLAVDHQGATTPYLNLNKNLLQFAVNFPGIASPRIHVWSALVDYTYPTGGYSLDPSSEIPVQAGVAAQLEFHWDAFPVPGRQLVSSRWMLDGDVFDDTPRSDPSDLVHWSAPGPAASEAQLPPLSPGVHRFYVEVMDNFGGKSLAIVKIDVIEVSPTHDLLVVDDTRLEVDKFNTPGIPNTYTQPWPSATELDTFLFARGGYPWRGTKNPTSGVISSPGLFAGYSFDTLGTRQGLENAASSVSLAMLSNYRHVLWLVDPRGASNLETFDQLIFPMTALRAMSRPGVSSTLAAYIEAGGQVWLAGGAAAFASLAEFDRRQNNVGQTTVFTVQDGELGPGRPIHDHVHLRSSVAVTTTSAQTERSPAAIGGWSGHGPTGALSAPDYSQLPATLRLRAAETDPMPPTRLASQTGLFYGTAAGYEYVAAPNSIGESMQPHGNSPRLESTLDTLYQASSPVFLVSPAPTMVYYHGRENAPTVFSGFDVWRWARADCQSLVDFVLGDIWGLAKGAPAPRTQAAAAAVRTAGPRRPAAMSQGLRR